MAIPSEDWSGFTGMSPGSDKYKRIKVVLSLANFEHLKKCAIDSRRRHQISLPPNIECNVELTWFATGFNNLVIKLTFSDGINWIARIPYRTINDNTKISLLSEIATMSIVRQRTSISISRIFDFEMSIDEPFGYLYVLMEYLNSRKLDNGLAKPIPPQYHTKAAKLLANVFAEL